MRGSFEVARQVGGRHHGFWLRYKDEGDRQIRKGIQTLTDRIADHQAWIENPGLKLPAGMPEMHARRYVEQKWPADIQRLVEERDVLIGILQERNRG